MASEGYNAAGAGADNSGTGTVAWASPGNITTSNDVRTTASLTAGVISHWLVSSSHGHTVPTGATINGIVLRIEKSEDAGIVIDDKVRIVQGGTIGTTDKASAATWNLTTDANADYGTGTTDLWGLTWTVAQINASGFGGAISAKNNGGGKLTRSARVDYMATTVYYTAAASGNSGNFFLSMFARLTFPFRNWRLVNLGLPPLAHPMQFAQTRRAVMS